ncbi:MAG: hypothetical protein KDE54_32625 [Caldilineaceae bacterium]|nr:hypothetical protein [Caldilineaceae bacterium]MCB0097507.1 hypothetical protein [Caldilineaceae bacterium]MCB0142977.1 hypothetical protein [Caldilineaceae bacterium]
MSSNEKTSTAQAQAFLKANQYIKRVLGNAFNIGKSRIRAGRCSFPVYWRAADSEISFMVGAVSFDDITNNVYELTADQIQDMKEAGPVQVAQKQGDLARDANGFVMRYQARIKASIWVSNRTDLKVSAKGGRFIQLDPPIWRFVVYHQSAGMDLNELDVIDVDALSGCVYPLNNQQLQSIVERVRANRQHQALAPAA